MKVMANFPKKPIESFFVKEIVFGETTCTVTSTSDETIEIPTGEIHMATPDLPPEACAMMKICTGVWLYTSREIFAEEFTTSFKADTVLRNTVFEIAQMNCHMSNEHTKAINAANDGKDPEAKNPVPLMVIHVPVNAEGAPCEPTVQDGAVRMEALFIMPKNNPEEPKLHETCKFSIDDILKYGQIYYPGEEEGGDEIGGRVPAMTDPSFPIVMDEDFPTYIARFKEMEYLDATMVNVDTPEYAAEDEVNAMLEDEGVDLDPEILAQAIGDREQVKAEGAHDQKFDELAENLTHPALRTK